MTYRLSKLTVINTLILHHVIHTNVLNRYFIHSEALSINSICLENVSFNVLCKELEDWLIKRNYKPTVVRKQILNARAFPRNAFLEKVKQV